MVKRPAIIRNSEVLPDPLAPIMASASPEEASKSRPENTFRPPLTHLTPRPESRILPFHSPLEIDGYRSRIFGWCSAAGRLSVWRCHWNDSISRNLMQHTIRVCKPSGQGTLKACCKLADGA